MPVRIVVIPEEGWLLDRWVGPVSDKAGNTAKIKMTSILSVVIKMKSTKPPAAEPAKPPIITYEEIERGGDSIFLEPAGCNSEHFERVTLQKEDRVELSVTAAKGVTIVVKYPHTGRKTVGKPDKFHDIVFETDEDGRHILIIAADYADQPYLQCNKRAAHVEYAYVISRPGTK